MSLKIETTLSVTCQTYTFGGLLKDCRQKGGALAFLAFAKLLLEKPSQKKKGGLTRMFAWLIQTVRYQS